MSIEIKSDILAKELNQGIVPLGVPKAYQYDAALVEAARAAVNQGIDDVAEAGATEKAAVEAQGTASVNAVSAQEQASKADVNALGDKILAQMKHGYGYPFTAASAAAMTDTTKIYVYTGSETGYTNGNWYYWNGTAWTSGGVYNATALETDTTLAVSGAAADAEATGNYLRVAFSPKIKESNGEVIINKNGYITMSQETSNIAYTLFADKFIKYHATPNDAEANAWYCIAKIDNNGMVIVNGVGAGYYLSIDGSVIKYLSDIFSNKRPQSSITFEMVNNSIDIYLDNEINPFATISSNDIDQWLTQGSISHELISMTLGIASIDRTSPMAQLNNNNVLDIDIQSRLYDLQTYRCKETNNYYYGAISKSYNFKAGLVDGLYKNLGGEYKDLFYWGYILFSSSKVILVDAKYIVIARNAYMWVAIAFNTDSDNQYGDVFVFNKTGYSREARLSFPPFARKITVEWDGNVFKFSDNVNTNTVDITNISGVDTSSMIPCVGVATTTNISFNNGVICGSDDVYTSIGGKWNSKIGNFLGDSITEQARYTSALTQMYNIRVNNYGASGTTISNINPTNTFSSRINAMTDDCDFIFVLGGTNDWGLGAPLGEKTDTTLDTFYGGLNATLSALRIKYPQKPIFVSNILQRDWTETPDQSSGVDSNINGDSVADFNEAIKYVAHKFGCKIIDAYGESGICVSNISLYTQDGLHLNSNGGSLYAKLIKNNMELTSY